MSNRQAPQDRPTLSRLFSAFLFIDVVVILIAITYLVLQSLGDSAREGVIENIAADLITASFFTLLGAAVFIWLSVIQRYRLFRFFGVRRSALGVQVYVSQLEVQPGGTAGTEEITVRYVGPAIVKIEYDACLLVTNLFRARAVALIPDVLRELLSTLFVTLADVGVDVEIAPTSAGFQTSQEQYLSRNLVTCGSAIYNSISAHYLAQESSFYYFAKDENNDRVLLARGDGAPNLAERGRKTDHELACIQRLKDTDNGVTVLICAGVGSGATYGAVDYLVRNWGRLWRQYRDNEFGLCLSFATPERDKIPSVPPGVIHREVRRRGRKGAVAVLASTRG